MMINIAGPNSTSNLSKFDDDQVQPNAVDLRVAKIFTINNNFLCVVDEDKKIHRGSDELVVDEDGYWTLEPGTYEIVMEGIVTVGPDEAGWVITRSTLNRNGIFLTSGLYDSGYCGPMAAALHVTGGAFRTRPGTRVGQLVMCKAEALHAYDGDYGIGKEHDKKYGVA